MKIDRLILQGFKSFGERTALEFGPGVFGIVGPNGSGKSNVVEALRWAVGARARELRGDEAQSLLFHGSDGRAPTGFAEVQLEVSRDKARVSMSRRLDRDGDTEVRLNGNRSTLRQIEHALMGTGLSRTGYAVVGQGEIGQILQAGPEVLLAYLEEAAGLRAVTQASKATRDKLEAATSEWVARSAEVEERRAAIAEKAEQAKAAKRAAELAARALILKRSLLQARIREADGEARAAREKAALLEGERQAVAGRIRAIESEKLAAMEDLDTAQNLHAEALRQAEAIAGDLRLAEQERQSADGLLKRLSQDLAETETRITRLRANLEPVPPDEPEPTGAANAQAEARAKELEPLLRAEEARLRDQQNRFENFLKTQATFEAQRLAYQTALAQRQRLEADRAELEARLVAQTESIKAAESRESELRARLNELVKQEGQLAAEARAAQSEAGRLEAIIRSGSDLAEGPKKARDAKIPGILGVVADLLEVQDGLELAVEIALGGRTQWVLTDSEVAAQKGIEHLKKQGGRATFLPRTLLKQYGKGRRDFSKEPGVLGVARDLVRLPACPEALPTLLGDTLVLQSLEDALALGKKFPDAPRMVTLEGELLETSGALTGGRVSKGGQMLALRRRFQEATAEAERQSEEASALGRQTATLRTELVGLNLETLRRQGSDLASELRALGGNLQRQAALVEPKAPAPVDPPDPATLEALRAEREALTRQLAQTREVAARWTRYREDVVRFKDAQLQTGDLETRLGLLRQEQLELGEKLRESQTRRANLEGLRAKLNLTGLEANLQAARQRTRALAEEETRLIGRTNQIVSDLEAQNITQARREATIETLQVELAEIPGGPVEEGSSRSLARLLTEVEQSLEEIGPVNHLAEREYELLSADVEKLEVALFEASEAVQKLEAELREVEGQYRGKMDEVYELFKVKFSEYAEMLLGAEVILERVAGGLDLILRPAGKRTVNLNLLSMGERTMGALAFLFALSEVGEGGGLPIAVLDEVDAPLDEANIQRFCRFLRQFSRTTQFILVTHQKRTMEACDALYGVTTDKGLSKVYSIKREEALA